MESMTNYIRLLEDSLQELQKWATQGKFDPKTEADIQCFLYHCLLEKLGSAKDIHAELEKSERKRIDLSIDRTVLVEIKYILRSGLRTAAQWRNRFRDAEKAINRLRNCMKDHIGVLVIFAENYRKEDEDWYDAVKELCERSGIIMLRAWKP